MSTTQLRKRLKQKIDRLPAGRLQSAVDFVEFLEERDAPRATPTVGDSRKIAATRALIARGERDVAAGRLTAVGKAKRGQ